MSQFQTDLDVSALRVRIAEKWLELSGEPLVGGSLEMIYREVLVMIATWAKIDTEKAISMAYETYKTEIYLLPYGAANRDAIIALARAYTDVADVNVAQPSSPMNIPVFLLAKTGTPTVEQIAGLEDYLNSSKVNNVCDTFVVAAASQLTWNFSANITVSGDPTALKTQATVAVTTYAAEKLKLAAIIRPTDLTTIIRGIVGIEDVALASPIANISTTANQFPKLGTLEITTTII